MNQEATGSNVQTNRPPKPDALNAASLEANSMQRSRSHP